MSVATAVRATRDCRHAGGFPSARVNGVRVDAIGRSALTELVAAFLDCGASHVVNFVPAYPTVLAQQDVEYARILEAGDLNLADGMSVAWSLRLHRIRADRIAGADALSVLPAWGLHAGVTHYFIGGSSQAERALCARLREVNPGLRIRGSEAPPFRPLTAAEVRAIGDRVRRAGTDLLWLGLGTPAQHRLAHELRRREVAPVILCVGAAFDFVSGAKVRAPLWMQRTGLEWTHRLASDPRRLWRRYLIGNPKFVMGVVNDYARAHRYL